MIVLQQSHTVGTELTTECEMTFPIAKGSMSLKVKYDYNTTKEVKSETSRTWDVPTQPVTVPAGKHYKVNWFLETGVAKGTTQLTTRVDAAVPFKKNSTGYRYGYSIGHTIRDLRNLRKKIPDFPYTWDADKDWQVDGGSALRKWSDATYEAKYGTNFTMEILDVTNSKSAPVLVKRIPVTNASVK